jgi:hypothetical protein
VALGHRPGSGALAAQALELYLHLAQLIMTRAAGWPAAEQPLEIEALAHVEPLYEAVARRVDPLGSARDVGCPVRPLRGPPVLPLPADPDQDYLAGPGGLDSTR